MIRRRSEGFSLVEIMITIAISAVVVAAVYAVVAATIKGDDKLRARVEMQLEAAEALRQITQLIKHSGPVDTSGDGQFTANGNEFPVFAQDGTNFPTGYEFLNSAPKLNPVASDPDDPCVNTTPVVQKAASTDPEGYFGPSVEMAFRLPRDNGSGVAGATDTDNYPTTPTGDIEWGRDAAGASDTETCFYAIVLVPTPYTGTSAYLDRGNELQLREYNRDRRFLRKKLLARGVERILFESRAATSFYQTGFYDPMLGANQLRVSIWFWRTDADGRPVKMRNASTINFRSVQR